MKWDFHPPFHKSPDLTVYFSYNINCPNSHVPRQKCSTGNGQELENDMQVTVEDADRC